MMWVRELWWRHHGPNSVWCLDRECWLVIDHHTGQLGEDFGNRQSARFHCWLLNTRYRIERKRHR